MVIMRENKIKSQNEIVKTVQNLKRKNKKIVTISGSFDILHLGHIKLLKEAKSKGDILIVLLNSDKSIQSYKGSKRPINYQKERGETLAALECVDFVTIFNEINPKKILEKIKPDIFCQGGDWGRNCIEREIVEKNGGKIYVFKKRKGFSTTRLIEKVLALYSKPVIKAIFLDRDGTINLNQLEYLYKIKDFKFAPFVIPGLKKLSKTDYKIIITSNQSGIGRGYFKEKDLKKLHYWMLQEFKKKGIRIDKIYYCPHRPEDNCSCRKPKIGMLQKSVKDFDISLDKSWVIGDDFRDILMGREANLKTIFLGSKNDKNLRKLKISPHYFVKNIVEAADIILRN